MSCWYRNFSGRRSAGTGGALVPAIVIDPSGPRHFVSETDYNHYSILRTIEDDWGLNELGFTSDHAQVSTMNEFLTG